MAKLQSLDFRYIWQMAPTLESESLEQADTRFVRIEENAKERLEAVRPGVRECVGNETRSNAFSPVIF